VGYSALTLNDAARTRAGSGGTAVRPESRGLGIATALKACCVGWARDHGIRRLVTSSGNPAMVRVNEKFGFRRTYVEVRLVKRFAGQDHKSTLGSE
jgi:GNAT superfamily N-acetyltransferase